MIDKRFGKNTYKQLYFLFGYLDVQSLIKYVYQTQVYSIIMLKTGSTMLSSVFQSS